MSKEKKNNQIEAKRRVCFVITSKIHFERNRLILEELRDHPGIELQVVVGGSALIEKYGNVLGTLKENGFSVDAQFLMALEGGGSTAMAKSAGIGLLELPGIFERLRPDIVLVRGDRYEVLPVAMASAYMNIPIAHIEGGDITGTIDESVRHAVTKLAHIHFATNEDSKRRIIQMGEPEGYVFNVGSPELELVARGDFLLSEELINYLGVGNRIDFTKPYITVVQHSVSSEEKEARAQIEETLHAVHELGIPAVWFWPNADAGTDDISKGIRAFRENLKPERIHFLTYQLSAGQFYSLLHNSSCLVGNSSSGLKEAALLGVPVVNIGTRQNGRRKSSNVVDVHYDRGAIKEAIARQARNGKYERDSFLYKEGTAKEIARILGEIALYSQKQFREND